MNRSRRLSVVDYAFCGLALLGVPEIVALAVNLATYPAGVGFAGQGLFARMAVGLIAAPAMLMMGTLIVWRAPGNVIGRFLILLALGGMAAQFDLEAAGPDLSSLALDLLVLYGAGVMAPSFGYLMFTFPTGQVYPHRLKHVVALVAVVKFIGAGLEILASPGKIRIFTPASSPLFVPALAPYQPIIAATIGIAGLLLPLIWLAGMLSLVLRYRASPARERQQMKWVLWALASLLPALLLMGAGILTGYVGASWVFPLATAFGAVSMILVVATIAIAILRHQLFDIDLIVNRTLVYGTLTACVVGLYALLVGLAGELVQQSGSAVLSLVITGLIAVLFQPLRERVQRTVNRLMYGERDDPYAVLSRLGQRLEETLLPQAILPTIVETVAQTLKLPYAAIQLIEGPGLNLAASYGLQPPSSKLETLALVYQSETVGRLEVARRAPSEAFTPAEHRLLAALAHQAGVAAHAERLTGDLQRARETLVAAREEERRRIRRDLHDGLGPALAAQTLKVGGVRSLLQRQLPALGEAGQGLVPADTLLAELEHDIAAALGDIRRLVYDLRPPSLDELGLVAAIRESAARYGPAAQPAHPLRIRVEAPEHLPALPAAVEVATFRIVQEALTNVVRHACARECVVRLSVDGALHLEISDDGIGLRPERQAGIGLASMRERAEELGGSCAIEPGPDGGTRVMAHLPLPHG